ncbi:MAG: GerMN domain-containing protein [Lachnospiraceae bacterium]|nr:GerMN domain-containing protein [Lachnospiraceae bacterium]
MKRKRLIRMMILLVSVLAVCLLSSCSKKQEQTEKPDPEKGIYNIYYKDAEETKLTSVEYRTKTKSKEELVKGLIKKLQSQEKDDPSVLPAVASDLEVVSYDLSLLPFLTVNFTKSYSEQKGADEILCRAALVMTLTQIPGVKYVEIQVEGQPLLDSAQKPVGKLSADRFLTDMNGNMFSRQKNKLLLYFASKDGKELVEVERTVLNDSSMALEKLVMKLLLEGPPDSAARAVLPDTVSILDISIRSGTCYVNFDSGFLTDTMDLEPEIIIYSIVDSLAELPDVSQVQIMVNGISDVKFKDSISLAEPFVKDLSYLFVQEEETEGEMELSGE